jgi:hypothetical protein
MKRAQAGVVNIVSGGRDHLTKTLTEHQDIEAMWSVLQPQPPFAMCFPPLVFFCLETKHKSGIDAKGQLFVRGGLFAICCMSKLSAFHSVHIASLPTCFSVRLF